ncbi:hypothetical protein [Winogradskyella endarachnes]|uniref:Uncharacterized protein n=1 Tax=Winogradskyella endarachnes TaxID=2681965 RepID=A0A6L6U7J3_9FLAO|nr:hypothetical protein [Winogradskyella endarachnes]MUU78223.1 hypothetical protein [Winogradskyella endarachnes]
MRILKQIRKKMLFSGKIKNYLGYAFGEILLIVIGVLIAWKINNLNELRKNRIVELKIYQSLNEELNSNLILLDSAIAQYNKNTETIENIMDIIFEEQTVLNLQEKLNIINVDYKSTQLLNGAITSVNSTNKFEFIESDVLKDLIASYPNDLDSFESQESKIENIILNRLQPVIEKHVSLMDLISNKELKSNKIHSFSGHSNYISLLKSREFQNSLVDRLLQTQIQLKNAISLREKTQTIAYNLHKELEN